MLEEDDRVRVADRGRQQALRVVRRRRRDDLQPGRCMNHASGFCEWNGPPEKPPPRRQPHDDRHGEALAVVHLAGDVHELVEAAGDEVGELHLADRPHARDRGADRRADDRRLGERRVHHARLAELLEEAVGDLERAAERADVLADHEHALVAAHLLAQPLGDRLR